MEIHNPLFLAVCTNAIDIIQVMLEFKCNIFIRDKNQDNIVHILVKSVFYKVIPSAEATMLFLYINKTLKTETLTSLLKGMSNTTYHNFRRSNLT